MRLIALLQVCGHRGKMADCVMDAVFALAEDWDAADFKVYELSLIHIRWSITSRLTSGLPASYCSWKNHGVI